MKRKVLASILGLLVLQSSCFAVEPIYCSGLDKDGKYYEASVHADDRFGNLSLNIDSAKPGPVPEGGGEPTYHKGHGKSYPLDHWTNDDGSTTAQIVEWGDRKLGNKQVTLLEVPNQSWGKWPRIGVPVESKLKQTTVVGNKVTSTLEVRVHCLVRPFILP